MHPFYKDLISQIKSHGGMFNAHLHLDRVSTLNDKYLPKQSATDCAHMSLGEKHSLINEIHANSAYDEANLRHRVNECLDTMVEVNTYRADTMVDVTADNVGLSAIQVLNEIKQQRKTEIDVRLAAYSPLGFIDKEPNRWDIFEQGVKQADFIGSLPEADDTDDYPSHIGFVEHCMRMIDLSRRYDKDVHVHTDQRNEPSETGTERLIEVMKNNPLSRKDSDEPIIWAVHMISPSTYDERRFDRMINGLIDCNIGVVVCPSAALGMRQLRTINTPTYNSIPRVLELLAAGVHVRLASDNIADILSPSTTADLIDEVYILSAALRFYHTGILAKLASGVSLNKDDRKIIKSHLKSNQAAIDTFRTR